MVAVMAIGFFNSESSWGLLQSRLWNCSCYCSVVDISRPVLSALSQDFSIHLSFASLGMGNTDAGPWSALEG